MKYLFPIVVLSLLTLSCKGEDILEGTYISKSPNRQEVVTIMYVRGYFHYLHSADNYIKLYLKADKTFNMSEMKKLRTQVNGVLNKKS